MEESNVSDSINESNLMKRSLSPEDYKPGNFLKIFTPEKEGFEEEENLAEEEIPRNSGDFVTDMEMDKLRERERKRRAQNNKDSKAYRARDKRLKMQMEEELARVKAENDILKMKESDISEPINENNLICESGIFLEAFTPEIVLKEDFVDIKQENIEEEDLIPNEQLISKTIIKHRHIMPKSSPQPVDPTGLNVGNVADSEMERLKERDRRRKEQNCKDSKTKRDKEKLLKIQMEEELATLRAENQGLKAEVKSLEVFPRAVLEYHEAHGLTGLGDTKYEIQEWIQENQNGREDLY